MENITNIECYELFTPINVHVTLVPSSPSSAWACRHAWRSHIARPLSRLGAHPYLSDYPALRDLMARVGAVDMIVFGARERTAIIVVTYLPRTETKG